MGIVSCCVEELNDVLLEEITMRPQVQASFQNRSVELHQVGVPVYAVLFTPQDE